MGNLWPKMTNDELINDEIMTNDQLRNWGIISSFWFRHSKLFHHSGFVIRNYFIILISSFIICLAGCGGIDEEVKSLTISPSSATVGINQSQLFAVIGKSDLGTIIDVTPTWSVTGGIGAINSSGLFTAGSTTAEGYVIASYAGLTASAEVTVTEKGWLIGRIQSIISSGFVPGIKVYLKENSALSDFSDSNGLYSISGIPAGTYEAFTEPTALYRVASQEVIISSGGTTTWNIYLETQPGISIVPTTTIPSF